MTNFDPEFMCPCCGEYDALGLLCDDCARAHRCLEAGPSCGKFLKSTEWPDFTTARAWVDSAEIVWERTGGLLSFGNDFIRIDDSERVHELAPWTPLRTAEDWAKQRDDLATAAAELSERTLMTASEAMAVLIAATDWVGVEKRTRDQWAKRIDRDALAKVIRQTPEPDRPAALARDVGMAWAQEIADAVIAALPELMGGEWA